MFINVVNKPDPTVRILKPGKLPRPLIYFASCHNCGCEFEWTAPRPPSMQLGGFSFVDRRTCPTENCGYTVQGVPKMQE